MKSLKIRLDLNNKQTTLCRKHAGVARHAYNWGVAECQKAFDNNREGGDAAYRPFKIPSAIDLHKRLVAEVKTENSWYYEVSKCAPQQALRNLQSAYQAFHRIQKPSGYKKRKTIRRAGKVVTVLEGLPQFKKKGSHDGFYLEGSIRPDGRRIKLPHFGWVRLSEAIPDSTLIKNVSVTRTADHWYISFRIEHQPVKTAKTTDCVGVDLGIKTLATLSNGQSADAVVFQAVKPYKRHKRQLKLSQRKVSKKFVKGAKKQSKNYQKAQQKVARLHARIANIRADALHKLTTHLAKNHSQIVIEDLNVRGMSKNHKLASAILDGGFFEFRRQLTYKAEWYGSEVIVADRFFASSKTCSGCGAKKAVLKLSERTYQCEPCGLQIDRDLNAAMNLRNYPTASYAGIACGAANNRTEYSQRVAMKQEANGSLSHQVQICVSLV